MSKSQYLSGLAIDASAAEEYFKAMQYLPKKMKADMRKELRTIGKEFLRAAQQKAGDHSTQIPSAIKLTVSKHGVWLYTSRSTRIAELYEYYGNHPKARFRHPVNADRTAWAPAGGSQPAHAFLKPTYDENASEWADKIIRAVEKALTAGGFEVR